MITLTENAVAAVSRFIQSSEKPESGLRIEAADGGCSGYQYGLRLEESPAESDTIESFGDIQVFIDDKSMPLLDGMTVDFVDGLEGSGFKFTNPNAAKSCACGSSFSAGENTGSPKSCS